MRTHRSPAARCADFAAGGRDVAQVYDILGLRVVVRADAAWPQARHAAAAQAATRPGSHSEDLAMTERAACYLVEDAVTAIWPQVASRRKDYIATPKANGYESLHLAVEFPTELAQPRGRADEEARSRGEPDSPAVVEVQIRSDDMHAAAERGGAAHFGYKGGLDVASAARLHEWTLELMTVCTTRSSSAQACKPDCRAFLACCLG
jgi:(p)ppGpp synthase/HD superfamily hydrolase